MTSLLGTLFINPIILSRGEQMLMLLPLCLAFSIVYKTTRLENLSHLPLAVLVNFLSVVIGMYAVGAGLLLLYTLLA